MLHPGRLKQTFSKVLICLKSFVILSACYFDYKLVACQIAGLVSGGLTRLWQHSSLLHWLLCMREQQWNHSHIPTYSHTAGAHQEPLQHVLGGSSFYEAMPERTSYVFFYDTVVVRGKNLKQMSKNDSLTSNAMLLSIFQIRGNIYIQNYYLRTNCTNIKQIYNW